MISGGNYVEKYLATISKGLNENIKKWWVRNDHFYNNYCLDKYIFLEHLLFKMSQSNSEYISKWQLVLINIYIYLLR